MIKYVQRQMEKDGGKVAEDLKVLFAGELNPVAPKAQKKVPVPEGYGLFSICIISVFNYYIEKQMCRNSAAHLKYFIYFRKKYNWHEICCGFCVRLDLDAWINEPPDDSSDDEFKKSSSIFAPSVIATDEP